MPRDLRRIFKRLPARKRIFAFAKRRRPLIGSDEGGESGAREWIDRCRVLEKPARS